MSIHDDWTAAFATLQPTAAEERAEEQAARERLAEQARALAHEAYCAEHAREDGLAEKCSEINTPCGAADVYWGEPDSFWAGPEGETA